MEVDDELMLLIRDRSYQGDGSRDDDIDDFF